MLPECCYEYRENILIENTREVVQTCVCCGENIYEGETYFNVNGDIYCVDCIANCEREA